MVDAFSETQIVELSEDKTVGEDLDEGTAPVASPSQDSATTEISAVERATQPAASWVEERLQSSSLLQASVYSREQSQQPAGERTLREAILLAREQFSGSVLSAERMNEDELNWFRIKILSEAGVLRLIDIDSSVPVSLLSTTPVGPVVQDVE